MITRFDVTRLAKIDDQGTRVDDYFFTHDVFATNANETWKESFGPFGEPQGKTDISPAKPRAVLKAVFVQFMDGSTWGDPAAGKDALRDRQLTRKELQTLADMYRTKPKEEFASRLMKASQYGGYPLPATPLR
jgi:hypothetical protein